MVLMGQAGDNAAIDLDALEERVTRPDYARVARSLYETGIHSSLGLLATYAGSASDLQPWLAGAEINRDGNLRLQYLAGLALNESRETAIYEQMLTYRKFPDHLFSGSEDRKQALRSAITGR